MDVTQLPFNKFIGLEKAPAESGFLITLPAGEKYTNHLNTVHASALFAAAEAASGAFLLESIGGSSNYIPVVRRVESKFRKPANGRISAKARIKEGDLERIKNELDSKKRTLITVIVDVEDESGVVALTSEVEWFITKL